MSSSQPAVSSSHSNLWYCAMCVKDCSNSVKSARLSRGRNSPEHAQPAQSSADPSESDRMRERVERVGRTWLEVFGRALDVVALDADQVRHRIPNRAPLQVPANHKRRGVTAVPPGHRSAAAAEGWLPTYATRSASIPGLLYGASHSGQSQSSSASTLSRSGSRIMSRSRLQKAFDQSRVRSSEMQVPPRWVRT